MIELKDVTSLAFNTFVELEFVIVFACSAIETSHYRCLFHHRLLTSHFFSIYYIEITTLSIYLLHIFHSAFLIPLQRPTIIIYEEKPILVLGTVIYTNIKYTSSHLSRFNSVESTLVPWSLHLIAFKFIVSSRAICFAYHIASKLDRQGDNISGVDEKGHGESTII